MSQVYEDYLQYLEDLADTLEQMAEVTKAKNKAAQIGRASCRERVFITV